MPPKKHALLGASSAHRWLACPPSARLEVEYADRASSFAAEGTLAHSVAEDVLNGSEPEPSEEITPEMIDCASQYAEFVRSRRSEGDVMFTEKRVDYSDWVPEGFGTCDCLILGQNTLTVIDYKYGRGVRVNPEWNPQLMLYALGALSEFGFAYDFQTVSLNIFQPRIANVSEWTLSRERLEQWGESTVKPTAQLAWSGEGQTCAGEHCRFCKAARDCKTLAEYSLAVVSGDFEDLNTDRLTMADYRFILDRANTVEAWLKTVRQAAAEMMLEKPGCVPGYKLVEGRTLRKYGDQSLCAQALINAGFEPDQFYKPRELISLTDMTRLVGKKNMEEVFGDLIVRPAGKPTIVPSGDKRPEYTGSAANDFNILSEENI